MLKIFDNFIPQFPEIEIELSSPSNRPKIFDIKTNSLIPIFSNNDDISLKININPINLNNNFDYIAIIIFLIGEYENFQSKKKIFFLNIKKNLLNEGTIKKNFQILTNFSKNNFLIESYYGNNFNINYYFELKIIRKFLNLNTEKKYKKNFLIRNLNKIPILNGNIRLEIGVNNKLHIEYELFQNKFHLNDVIIGKIFIVDINTIINFIEINLIKKEIFYENNQKKFENFILGRMEICDGQPYEKTIIPFRFYLKGRNLTPTVKNNDLFEIKYYVKFIVVLESEKILYKAQEIFLYRSEYV
jgi:vacuolar protein sorting-associated protein 26